MTNCRSLVLSLALSLEALLTFLHLCLEHSRSLNRCSSVSECHLCPHYTEDKTLMSSLYWRHKDCNRRRSVDGRHDERADAVTGVEGAVDNARTAEARLRRSRHQLRRIPAVLVRRRHRKPIPLLRIVDVPPTKVLAAAATLATEAVVQQRADARLHRVHFSFRFFRFRRFRVRLFFLLRRLKTANNLCVGFAYLAKDADYDAKLLLLNE